MRWVCKFGGSSLSSGAQFKKVKAITFRDERRQVIVVSALGRRHDSDNKLTDMLYSLHEYLKVGAGYDDLWAEITSRFLSVKSELGLTYDLEGELARLKDALAARASISADYVVSRGEYLTAKLMSEYLGFQFLDAKDLIIFDNDGEVDFEASEQAIVSAVRPHKKVVIPGFYGRNKNNEIKLFSRGGSDISGAIVAAALGAEKYENFTDVPGVLMVDPRIVKNPRAIAELSYNEMGRIAGVGAEVLHPKSVDPVRRAGILIHIQNTNDPDTSGTLIHAGTLSDPDALLGFFGRKDFVVTTLSTKESTEEKVDLQSILNIFSDFNIEIEQINHQGHQIKLLVPAIEVKYVLDALIARLQLEAGIEDLKIDGNFALISIFARNKSNDAGFIQAVIDALRNKDLDAQVISKDFEQEILLIRVDNERFEETLNVLYEEFVTVGVPAKYHFVGERKHYERKNLPKASSEGINVDEEDA